MVQNDGALPYLKGKTMKVRVISRDEEDFTRRRPSELNKVHRNADPKLHPFSKAKEYTRALNAAKWDKVFAKPFIGALDGHRDGVFSLVRSTTSLRHVVSGACDGEIRIWDMSTRDTVRSLNAHAGFVRGLTVSPDGTRLYSCGDDKRIKSWNFNSDGVEDDNLFEPVASWRSKYPFSGIDHHWRDNVFATAGHEIAVWDATRSEPKHTFSWGADSTMGVWFNPAETDVFASCGTDRGIVLYDLRTATPLKKLIMEMKTNQIAWNPMEPFYFVSANEDHNCYSFDMRKMETAINVHMDHVGAVLSVSFSPTGQEFATASYDRTIRIFPTMSGRSREVYHTKRMQRVFNVLFTGDSKYVLSGSEDTNIRIWKAHSSKPVEKQLPREKAKMEYLDALKKRYLAAPEIKRISRHRHLPKGIHKQRLLKGVMKTSDRRKQANIIRHSTPGSIKPKSERKKHMVGTEE